jgi:hypothetical protein
MKTVHELDISSYTLDEIMDLFQLDYNMTMHDLKQTKQKVLMLHPDKSKLPAEYFLFYKKAFEYVVEIFEELNKQNRPMTKEATKYNANTIASDATTIVLSKEQMKQIREKVSHENFNQKFNELFEKNGMGLPATIDKSRNSWFENHDETSPYTLDDGTVITNSKNMDIAMSKMKEQTHALSIYNGVNEMYSYSNAATSLYGETEEETRGRYVSSDPFQKLKYDDIRKVHKDETILHVDERDQRINQRMSVDQYSNTYRRNEAPISRSEAESILAQKRMEEKKRILEQEHKSKLTTVQNMEKTKSVMSYLLRLEN